MKIEASTKQRDVFVDLLRAFAIVLVVIGHSIQYGNGRAFLSRNDFFHLPLFVVIYGFHIPLFMVISGYLFRLGIDRKGFVQILTSRFYSLLLPIMVWGGIDLFIRIAVVKSVEVTGVVMFVRMQNSAESDRLISAQSDRSVSAESDRSISPESDRFRYGPVRLTQSA